MCSEGFGKYNLGFNIDIDGLYLGITGSLKYYEGSTQFFKISTTGLDESNFTPNLDSLTIAFCVNVKSVNTYITNEKQDKDILNLFKRVENIESNDNNIFSNKKINFLGDSITFGKLQDPDNGQMEYPYPTVVKQLLGASEVRNYGISGSCLCSPKWKPMSERFLEMDDNADVVVVFGGTNDFGGNVPLGVITDKVNTTIYGALNIMCEGLIKKYPNAIITFVTPLKRTKLTNTEGYKLEDVANAIIEVCGNYSIPVLDLFRQGNFNPLITEFRNLYAMDGLHPTQDFVKKVLARKIANHLIQIV